MPIVPSLPFKAMPSLPSSPLTVIVPGSLSLPMVTSLFKPTCNFALPFSSITLVVTLPSPLTVTVSPSLALTSLPFSSVKPKPLLVRFVMLSFKSPTLTALFNVSPSASFNSTLVPSAFFRPLSTLTIWLPPLFRPLSVTLTVLVLSASFGVTAVSYTHLNRVKLFGFIHVIATAFVNHAFRVTHGDIFFFEP